MSINITFMKENKEIISVISSLELNKLTDLSTNTNDSCCIAINNNLINEFKDYNNIFFYLT